MAQLIANVAAEIGQHTSCLEIGVGTGRFALPLARAGVRMSGVDISRDMLERLVENSNGTTVDVCLADATMLPFADHTFDSAIAVHVLHLIPRWQNAVDQLLRVVKPGGKFLAERGGRTEGDWWHELRRRFLAEAGDPPWPPGLDRVEQLDEVMRARGAAIRFLPELVDVGKPTANDLLAALEAGIWSACWSLDEATRRRSAAVVRAWAEQNLGDLDEPRPFRQLLTWRVYELP